MLTTAHKNGDLAAEDLASVIGVPAAHAAAWARAVAGHEVSATRIGKVLAGHGVTIAE